MRQKKLWKYAAKRNNLFNLEIKRIILKSVKKNKNIENNKRVYAYYKLIKIKNKYIKHTEACLISGKSRGVWKFCNLGRHSINELNKTAGIMNISSSSW